MSEVPSKKCKKESKFKLKARMQDINAVQEYEDVDLHDTFYKKGSVSRIMTDEECHRTVEKSLSVFVYHPCVICWTKLNLMWM